MKKKKKYENLINKTKILSLIFLIAMLLLTISCKKEKEQREINCTCSSETIKTINDQIGYLYKDNEHSNPNLPFYNYAIYYNKNENGLNIHYNYFICNEIMLKNIDNVPDYPGIEVVFTGKTKKVCKGIASPPEYYYYNLTLTKIKKQ